MRSRRLVIGLLLVLAVVGPIMILTDNDVSWSSRTIQLLIAAAVCLAFVGIAIGLSAAMVSGDISEAERRRGKE